MTQERLPLSGCEVVITRAAHQQAITQSRFKELGATSIAAPMIALVDPPEPDSRYYEKIALGGVLHERDAIDQFESFQVIIFTSGNAVKYLNRLWSHRGGLKAMMREHQFAPRVICIGSSTRRALTELGIMNAETPAQFHAEGILSLFNEHSLTDIRVLIPRALVAREIIPQTLRTRGAEVWVMPVYQTVSNSLSSDLRARLIASPFRGISRYYLFTSDSTVHSFINQLSSRELMIIQGQAHFVMIGPVVARAAERLGLRVDRVAEPHTLAGLIQAVCSLHSASTSQ